MPDTEQAPLEVGPSAASPAPGTPAAQAAAEALEAVALEEGFRARSLMGRARLSAANAAAVAAARAGQELPATLLDATAGEQLPVTPAAVVQGRAASVPGQTAADLQAADAAMRVQQVAKAGEAARAAAAAAAARRGWERVRQPVQVTLTPTLVTAAWGRFHSCFGTLQTCQWECSQAPVALPSLAVSHATAAQTYLHILSSSAGRQQIETDGCAPEGLHSSGAAAHCCCQHKSLGCPWKTANVQLAGPPQPSYWRGLQPCT